jgi:hypothetical protein
MTVTPSSLDNWVGPVTKVTNIPFSLAARARAKPIFPDDGFEINLTGSIHSRVGPAEIKQCNGSFLVKIDGDK